MSVRGFGSIWQKRKPGGGFYPGYYVSFPLRRKGEPRPRRFKKYGGDCKAAARRVLARIETMAADGRDAPEILHEVFGDLIDGLRTFVQLADLYMERPRKPDTDADTIVKENRRIRSICKAPWAKELVTTLRPPILQRWLDERFAEASCATANRDRAKVSAIFTWGIPRGFATSNPAAETVKFDESGREKNVYLTSEEAVALLDVASPRLRTFVVIALSTALRRGAIMRLCWEHLDFDTGFFNLPPGRSTKGIPRRLPMTPAVKAELLAHRARCAQTSGADPLFDCSVDTIRDDLRRARRVCEKIPAEKRLQIGFHALRHTAASWMAQDGVPLYEIAKILGHGSVYVTTRYAHLVPGWAQGPIDKLAARLRPEDLPAMRPVLAAPPKRGPTRSSASTPVFGDGPRLGACKSAPDGTDRSSPIERSNVGTVSEVAI